MARRVFHPGHLMLLLFHQRLETLLHVRRCSKLLGEIGIHVTPRMIYHYRDWLIREGFIRIVTEKHGKRVELTQEGKKYVKKCLKLMLNFEEEEAGGKEGNLDLDPL